MASPAIDPPPERDLFAKLPTEILENICSHALHALRPIHLHLKVHNNGDTSVAIAPRRTLSPQLLATCKRIRQVGTPYLYSKNHFIVPHDIGALEVMLKQCDKSAHLLRFVRVDCMLYKCHFERLGEALLRAPLLSKLEIEYHSATIMHGGIEYAMQLLLPWIRLSMLERMSSGLSRENAQRMVGEALNLCSGFQLLPARSAKEAMRVYRGRKKVAARCTQCARQILEKVLKEESASKEQEEREDYQERPKS